MENQEPTSAEVVAQTISGFGTTFLTAQAKSVAYRVPVHLLVKVDAMAAHGKKSRNAMLNLLVRVGVDEVTKQLSTDVAEQISKLENDQWDLFLDTTNAHVQE